MQLFLHADLQIQGDQLKLKNAPEIVRQLRKVLRAKAGYYFFVQNAEARFSLELINRTDSEVFAKIREKNLIPQTGSISAMAIAFPNKQEKLELIVQKLTEIGISKIYLRPAERSVLSELSPQKRERLLKIVQEAAEQSRAWRIPEIICISSFSEIREEYQMVVFDLGEREKKLETGKISGSLCGVIGPEGGLTEKDYQNIGSDYLFRNLGSQVLRMETAAIIAAWLINQQD